MKNTLYSSMTAELDEQATAENAAAAIVQYPTWRARAMVSSYVSTPKLDGMPRSKSGENVNDKRITDRLDYAERVRVIDGVLVSMRDLFPDFPFADLIKWQYCKPLQNVDTICERLGYGNSWFYKNRPRALCILAVLWPADWGTLTVSKTGDD